jgi:hypothetical protein
MIFLSFFKKILLYFYFIFFNAKNRIIKHFRLFFIPKVIKKRAKIGVFAIDISTPFGLGSKLCWMIEILAYCDEHSYIPFFRFSYPNEKDDYFNVFFKIKNEKKISCSNFTKINSMLELGFKKNYGDELTIKKAGELLRKYFIISEKIQDEVDSFIDKSWKDNNIIGVHYRGTDKIGEAPKVLYEEVLKNIIYVNNHFLKSNNIFVASDDNNFIIWIRKNLIDFNVITREDYLRSNDEIPVHTKANVDKLEINKDALINLLLLSRCDFLLKSCSFLSDVSKLLNPSLPTVVLNRPYDRAMWFPISKILLEMPYLP